MYNQLLISAGGGIANDIIQSDRADTATLIIGLGGTGKDAVIKIKREVYKQLKPDDENAEIKSYKSIKYLVIDSDPSKIKNDPEPDEIGESEFVKISVSSIARLFANPNALVRKPEYSWLNCNLKPEDATNGANGTRQIGRFLLVYNIMAVSEKINHVIESLRRETNVNKIDIHICAGISGGTGSGIFLDVCYLVRNAIDNLTNRIEPLICGYFFLPDINLSKPEVGENATMRSIVIKNGYAALKELDYCMNLVDNKDRFSMYYGDGITINTNSKPVDLCYLISATDVEGTLLKKPYEYALGVVAEHILEYLAYVTIPQEVKAKASPDDGGLTLKGLISNFSTIKSAMIKRYGAQPEYEILGVSVVEMPRLEIATYLGSKLFSDFYSNQNKPVGNVIDNFMENNALSYDRILDDLKKGVKNELIFPDGYDIEMYIKSGGAPFVEYAKYKFYNKNLGIMEENYRNLTGERINFGEINDSVSLINRTYKELCEKYALQYGYGVTYVCLLINGGDNFNLLNKIDAYIKKCEEDLETANNQYTMKKKELDDINGVLKGKIKGNLKTVLKTKVKLIEKYKAISVSYYEYFCEVEYYNKMIELLRDYREKTNELSRHFRTLNEVLEKLNQTFEKNLSDLANEEVIAAQELEGCTEKVLTISQINERLNEYVKESGDMTDHWKTFLGTLLKHSDTWDNAGKVCRVVSDYFMGIFKGKAEQDMIFYLQFKYDQEGSDLINSINNDLFRNFLAVKSEPKFDLNGVYMDSVHKLDTLTVPYNSGDIIAAANKFKASVQNLTVRKSGIVDKIILMKFHVGIPMFAYYQISNYEQEYEKAHNPGIHLFENNVEERNYKDWREWIPSPIPASFERENVPKNIQERQGKLLKEFDNAKDSCIIEEKEGKWYIKTLASKIEDINKFPIEDIKKEQIKGELERIGQIENDFELTEIITGNMAENYEAKIVRDFYLRSPIMQKMVQQEVEKITTIHSRKKELEKILMSNEADLRNDFFEAIFAGVLEYNSTIVFRYEKYQQENVIVLQSRDMPYGRSGPYQAFLTFKNELDDEMRARIKNETDRRIDLGKTEESEKIVENLWGGMGSRIEGYLDAYEENMKYDEMKAFFGEFMKQLDGFRKRNGYI